MVIDDDYYWVNVQTPWLQIYPCQRDIFENEITIDCKEQWRID